MALTCLVLLVAGLVGGGQGGLGDLAAQECALVMLAWIAFEWLRGSLRWHGRWWIPCLPLLALALPLLQLLPLPEIVWGLGDERRLILTQLGAAGVSVSGRVSLDPATTESALWSLLPATAMFLGTLFISARARKVLLFLLLGLALANIALGMAQLADGVDSPLRLYSPTNLDQAVGLFANRNHMASLLAMCLPIALVWTGSAMVDRLGGRTIAPMLIVLGAGVVVALVVGIALTGSRSGLLLGFFGALGSLPLALARGRHRGATRILVAALGIGVMIVVQLSLLGALNRSNAPSHEDGRLEYTVHTLQAAKAYLPFGSGLGTFRRAYQPFEAANPSRYIVNHAHNEYVELLLEGGIPALVLMLAGLVVWVRQGLSLMRGGIRPEEFGDSFAAMAVTAWLAGSVALLHSALDFPLRTTAAMTAFALLAGIAFGQNSRNGRSLRSRRAGAEPATAP
jgi:O-antigen ligase